MAWDHKENVNRVFGLGPKAIQALNRFNDNPYFLHNIKGHNDSVCALTDVGTS
ncbi:2133_t:CDS:2 [Entrophospora sp. SA101]|nr:2133_t:CDS:2 [Entrophospora sp. SA101]